MVIGIWKRDGRPLAGGGAPHFEPRPQLRDERRVGRDSVLERDALRRQPFERRRLADTVVVHAQGRRPGLVAHDEQDVWSRHAVVFQGEY